MNKISIIISTYENFIIYYNYYLIKKNEIVNNS